MLMVKLYLTIQTNGREFQLLLSRFVITVAN